MKNIKTGLAIVLLVSVYFFSCNKENPEKKDEWIEIDSIVPGEEIAEQLNYILSKQNECLLENHYYPNDTLFFSLFNNTDFNKIDTCNTHPEIDYSKYTLTIGILTVPVLGYKISDYKLFSNDARAIYRVDISIDTCEYCFQIVDVIYFWRLYPKLQSNFQFKLSIKNVN